MIMASNIGKDTSGLEDSFPSALQKFNETIENISMPSGCGDSLNVSNFTQSPSDLSDFLHSKFSEVSDMNNTFNCTDFLLKEINEGLKAKTLLDENITSEIINYKNLLNEVNIVRKQSSISKFVVETLKEMFENSSQLSPYLRKKCCQRIRFINLMSNPNYSNLLKAIGVDTASESFSLSGDEKKQILSTLQEVLCRKSTRQKIDSDVVSDLLGNFSKSVPLPGSTMTEDNVRALKLIDEISDTVSSCFKLVWSVSEAIKDLCSSRVQKFQKLHINEMDCLASKTKLLELKLKNLNSMIENAMIQENDSVNQALDLLHQKLKTILDDSEYSLMKTEDMKRCYDALKGTKFDEVLREYLEVRESMKHKQWALKQIKKI